MTSSTDSDFQIKYRLSDKDLIDPPVVTPWLEVQ